MLNLLIIFVKISNVAITGIFALMMPVFFQQNFGMSLADSKWYPAWFLGLEGGFIALFYHYFKTKNIKLCYLPLMTLLTFTSYSGLLCLARTKAQAHGSTPALILLLLALLSIGKAYLTIALENYIL